MSITNMLISYLVYSLVYFSFYDVSFFLKNLCMYYGDKVLDFQEEVLNIEVWLCTNVEDGRLGWVNSWAKSIHLYIFYYNPHLLYTVLFFKCLFHAVFMW